MIVAMISAANRTQEGPPTLRHIRIARSVCPAMNTPMMIYVFNIVQTETEFIVSYLPFFLWLFVKKLLEISSLQDHHHIGADPDKGVEYCRHRRDGLFKFRPT